MMLRLTIQSVDIPLGPKEKVCQNFSDKLLFFAEKIYQTLKIEGEPESVHLCKWPKTENKKIKAEWLRWETGFSIPINIRDDVYYKGHDFLQITCCEPRKDLLDDIVRGEVICKLNPNDWDIEKIKEIINNIKNR